MKIHTCLTILLMGWMSVCSASSLIKQIDSPHAPKSVGAYSQAIVVDLVDTKSLLFVSGQVPFNPKTGQMESGNIRQATNQALDNIEAILKEAGTEWKYVVRTDVFLQEIDRDWAAMDEEYAKRFPEGIFPARQTVGVKMGDDTLIEISCIAIIPGHRTN